MPIEVRELIIKGTVTNAKGRRSGGGTSKKDRESMIQDCVDKVMEILKDKKDR